MREINRERAWTERHTKRDVIVGHLEAILKPSETKIPKTYEDNISENLLMKDMEPELPMLCNPARPLVVHLGHQPIH